jgi:hypothetical protein
MSGTHSQPQKGNAMTTWDFPCSDPVDISIDSWGSGSIVVSGEPTSTVAVEIVPGHLATDVADLMAQIQVAFDDGHLYIHGPRHGAFRRKLGLDLTIKAPQGSSCAARTVSADLACVGELGALAIETASGDVTAASVNGDVTVKSASGDVLLNVAGGDVTVSTASGDIQALRVDGDARIDTASGDVAIGYCASSVSAHTASGDIRLEAVAAGQVELISASGDMQVAVVPGIGVYLDLASTSGDIRSDLDASAGEDPDEHNPDVTVQLSCRTLSGDIRVTKARHFTGPPVPPVPPMPPVPPAGSATQDLTPPAAIEP